MNLVLWKNGINLKMMLIMILQKAGVFGII